MRRDILLKAAELLEQRTEEYAGYMRTEMGANVGTSQFFAVPMSISMLKDLASRITSICGSIPVAEREGQSCAVYKEPMGVILGIVPWLVVHIYLYIFFSANPCIGMLHTSLEYELQLVLLQQEIQPSSRLPNSRRAVSGPLDVPS